MSEVTSSQNVSSSNNVTGGGVDYDSGTYTVTFLAGETTVSFDVPINDDNLSEDNEAFQLIIMSRSLPDNVIRGNPGKVEVTILDNDSKYCHSNIILKGMEYNNKFTFV